MQHWQAEERGKNPDETPPPETIQEQFWPEEPFTGLIQITGLNNYLWEKKILSCKDIHGDK